MSKTIQIAPVTKSIVVNTSQAHAFDVFTAKIDSWWPKTHGIGEAPIRESVIEPFVGGRWYSRLEDDSERTIGHILEWEPPQRFIVTWEINAEWKPDSRRAFTSEIEVNFIVEGAGQTRVELEHRNFERMGFEPGNRMHDDVNNGWPGLLELFAAEVNALRNH